ncbi:hypothetical protein VOLCADRAFT_116364 [Volvox carteri f. nagariensis]|uniref:Uncharacterized protein n=1 Tax=Volvox carteri f. nagariensis TaxID=3068 RepID=D8TLM2_VOLCA|nr:uncharacterized protein VOLCADRAFT_116364 [Volvox carteri f. nagariensis]EFJ51899.1 hypothetical protein VOLCADRAFT_116364 [Volvox carteri f. nagariensis]|eukprot:XP_002947309.1 hypothetical protein VOLCADRAFT_116364 [Volvox carteri f. nagariensis]
MSAMLNYGPSPFSCPCGTDNGRCSRASWPRAAAAPAAPVSQRARGTGRPVTAAKATTDGGGGDRSSSSTADVGGTSPHLEQAALGADGGPQNTARTDTTLGTSAGKEAPEGQKKRDAVQSEYVEEYETVYETETEERGGGAGPDARLAGRPSATAAPGGPAVAVAEAAAAPLATALGVGSTAAEVATLPAREAAVQHQASLTAPLAVVPPTPAPLPYAAASGFPPGAAVFLGGSSVGGWALAAALLLAIRMSRQRADEERLDLQALQDRQAEGRQLGTELRSRRKAYLEEERRRLEEEAAKRVSEARARQEEEARLAAERQRQWQEEVAREAQRMQAAVTAAAAMTGTSSKPYESAAAAVEGAAELAATAGTAPAAVAGDDEDLVAGELRHWARMAHLQLLASCRQLVCQLAPLLGPGENLEQEFQCRISRQVPPAVLPPEVVAASAAVVLPPAVAPSLRHAAAAAISGQLQLAVDVIDGIIAREEEAAAAGRDGAANGAALPPLAVAALLYAEVMEAAGYAPSPPPPTSPPAAEDTASSTASATADSKEEERSEGAGVGGVGDGTALAGAASTSSTGSLERLARYQLSERARGAPPDSLMVTTQLLRLVLPGGPRHSVYGIMEKLAENNMSTAVRQAMQIRRQRTALEAQAVAVLQQQRGGTALSGRGGALVVGPGGEAEAARGALVPVPERLWATRNVANNLMRFGEPLQVGEAVGMLEEAVSLARRHYGDRHPGQLAVLLDYLDALAAEAAVQSKIAVQDAPSSSTRAAARALEVEGGGGSPGVAARRARAAEELLEVVQVLCERYQRSPDPLSCVLLLEAAVAEVTPALRATSLPGRGGDDGPTGGSATFAVEAVGSGLYGGAGGVRQEA